MIERTFIEQGMKKLELERYVKEQLGAAGFTHLDIVKTPLVTRIVLNVVRPGLAIGKGGQTINQLTQEIGTKFGIDNPQIEIKEIQNANLDAKANVDKIVSLLERGYSWRSVAFKAMNDIMRAGAQGAELIFSGKLAGKGGRKKKVRLIQGYMKKVGDQTKLVDFAQANAYPKPGAIGIKLRIIHPGVVFPDKMDIRQAIAKIKEANAPAEETKTEEEIKEEVQEQKEKPEEKKHAGEEKTPKPVSKTGKKKAAKKAKEAEEKKETHEKAEAKHEKKEEHVKEEHKEKKTHGEKHAEKEHKKKEHKKSE